MSEMILNRLLPLLTALLLTGCTHYPCEYAREDLSLTSGEKSVYGVLYRPKITRKAPLVVISHGFGGTHQFGTAYAEALAPLGYAVYCYDFCGGSNWSRSEGKTSEMSIFSEAGDLKAVVNELCEKSFIDSKHITLIGESQGGMVSALVAAERKSHIERLILIYPAFCIKDDWVKMYPALEDMPEEVDFWGMKLGRAYLKGLYDLDVYGAIKEYKGPVSIFHGDKDQVVNLSYAERASEVYENATLTVLPGEGHGFRPEAQKQVIGAIKELLRR